MLTRCPHCQTQFRVTSEQLKTCKGSVRCGECRAIFDALESLADEPPVVLPAAVVFPDAPTLPVEPAAIEAPVSHEFRPASVPEPQLPLPASLAPEPEAALEPEPVPVSEAPPAPEPAVEPQPYTEPEPESELRPAPEPEPAPAPAPAPGSVSKAVSEPVSDTETLPMGASGEPVSPASLIPAVVPPPRRLPLIIGIILLVLLASAQASYVFRAELAVVMPEWRPILLAACETLGCNLPRPHKSELVDIASSDLAPVGKGLLLAATLKNRAPFDQEYPHLELTLTDTDDAPLVRKVLAPADYLRADRQVADGFAAGGELEVHLSLDADELPAVGYRLYLFYP